VLGLVGQVVVLVALWLTTGIGVEGWATGLAYGLTVCVALIAGLRRARTITVAPPAAPGGALTPADWVTLTRSCLVGGVAALTAHSFRAPVPAGVLVGIAAVALVLDAVDGTVARRTRTRSRLGARFDLEVDAFLILVLSVFVARMLGPWALAIGAMRYALWAAERVLPWLPRPVPARLWRKIVAGVQGIVLTAAASGLFPTTLSVIAVAVALALLVESFGRDVIWLWRRRRAP
jgi:phosphatidylglycerophosphate synthase